MDELAGNTVRTVDTRQTFKRETSWETAAVRAGRYDNAVLLLKIVSHKTIIERTITGSPAKAEKQPK
ncbi:MAG: hypothetical protein ABF641_12525, partial [Acetobacter sp.]